MRAILWATLVLEALGNNSEWSLGLLAVLFSSFGSHVQGTCLRLGTLQRFSASCDVVFRPVQDLNDKGSGVARLLNRLETL